MLIQKPRLPLREIILFGLFPSFLKKILYRVKGYKIGKGVSIGFGSVVNGEEVIIGDHTQIGFLTVVRGKKIVIGEYVSIGTTVFLDTPFIEIGDGSKINEQVFVGGLQFPDSKFVMGRNCQIMQMTFINPARSVTIGDDSGIGGHCLIFGHTSWLSIFEGYPVDFQPIEIGKSVSIAWGAFLLPGTQVGDGAVIGAKSVVSRTVPPKCLAVGFPARVVSRYPDFPIEVGESQKREFLERIINDMLSFFKDSGLLVEFNGKTYEITEKTRTFLGEKRRSWRLAVSHDELNGDNESGEYQEFDVFLSLNEIPFNWRKILDSRRIVWIDIEKKEQSYMTNDLAEEVLLFLRRYGVRFVRIRTEENKMQETGKRTQ